MIVLAYNNFENLNDCSASMKHLERCSYIIPENLFKDKWEAMVKAWANNPIQDKNGLRLIIQNIWRDKV
jgi:hypothetical protein